MSKPPDVCHTATPGTAKTYPPRQTLDATERPKKIRLDPKTLLAYLPRVAGVAGVTTCEESSNGRASRSIESATPAPHFEGDRCGKPSKPTESATPATPTHIRSVAGKKRHNSLSERGFQSSATLATPVTPPKTIVSETSEAHLIENESVRSSEHEVVFSSTAGVAGVASRPLPSLADLAAALGQAFPIEAGPRDRVMVDTAAVLTHATEDDVVDLVKPHVLVAFAASLVADGLTASWTVRVGHELPVSFVRRQGPCRECRHFQPDTVGFGQGIGQCAINAPASQQGPAMWPNADRNCSAFERPEPTAREEPTPC